MSLYVSVSEPADDFDMVLRGVPERSSLTSVLLLSLDVLAHLDWNNRADIVAKLEAYHELFSDTPTFTSVLEHDIEVGDTLPIKPHPYKIQ